MLVHCPHCTKSLKLNEKAVASLKKLPQGKSLKVQCNYCKESFSLNSHLVEGENQANFTKSAKAKIEIDVRPPEPPDIGWLSKGEEVVQQAIVGIPKALIVVRDEGMQKTFRTGIERLGYQVELCADFDETLQKVFRSDYKLIIYHSLYEEGGLENSRLHQYLCRMPMSQRRPLFYVLVGPEMQTLYDLQALVYSANLVVNDSQAPHIEALVKKSFSESEALFEPLVEELRLAGR